MDLSVRNLAQKSGVATATVHELESLKRAAKPATRQALAKALRCRVGDLTKAPEEANVKT
jgi:DNA-binding Xre family transcriptional regulator